MTLQARIEALLGKITRWTALPQWMKEGARYVIQSLPEDMLWLVSQERSDTGLGLAVGTSKILYAHLDGRRARRVPASMRASFEDSSSIHAASDFSPVYWLEHGKVFVRGDEAGGVVVYVAYPTPLLGDTAITGFPAELDHLVVLYASAMHRTSDVFQNAPPEEPEAATVPTAPAAPAISSVDAVSVAPTAVTIGSLPSAPVYTAPTAVSLTALGTVTAIDLSGIAVPSAPASATLVAAFPAAPTFSPPTDLALSFAEFDAFAGGASGEDPEMAGVELGKLRAETDQYAQLLQKALGAFNASLSTWEQEVAALFKEADLAEGFQQQKFQGEIALYQAEVEAAVRAHMASIERAASLYRAEGEIETAVYRAQVDNAAHAFQASLAEHQAAVQKVIEQARITAQEAALTAAQATDLAKFNEAQTLQALVQDYELELRRYEAQIAHYGAEQTALINLYQAELSAWETERKQHAEDAQRLWGLFREGLSLYTNAPIAAARGEA